MANKKVLELFWYWIRERENIRVQRAMGVSSPWTDDEVLGKYYFCNVRREDDKVTRELRELAKKHCATHELPWYYTLARLFNYAPTMKTIMEVGEERAVDILEKRMSKDSEKVFHTAYLVSTCGESISKVAYCFRLAGEVRKIKVPEESLDSAYRTLIKVRGLASFMVGQVIADLKNDRYLSGAPDWFTWSTIGPGSKKGMDFIFGDESPTTAGNYQARIDYLYESMPEDIRNMRIHAQDLQNCLCEFSKYCRYKIGGRGRSRIYHHE